MTTRPDVGLDEAIAICKEHGYAVIKREMVLDLHASAIVDNKALYQYRGQPGYQAAVLKDAYHNLAHYLAGKGICRLDTDRTREFTTEFRLTLHVIPADIETDPILEMMRDADRGRH